MKLLPSLRQTKRYVLFEIVASRDFSVRDIEDAVTAALRSFLGELGMARAGPMFLKEKSSSTKFVMKVNHTHIDELKSALILIKSIKNTPVLIRSILTSGTLKKVGGHL